jgi:hypothetical protein
MNNWCIFLVFRAYLNEMHGSRNKIPSKKSRQAALRRYGNLKKGNYTVYNHPSIPSVGLHVLTPLAPEFSFKFKHTLYLKCE